MGGEELEGGRKGENACILTREEKREKRNKLARSAGEFGQEEREMGGEREGGREQARDLSFVRHLSKEAHELRGPDELVNTGT